VLDEDDGLLALEGREELDHVPRLLDAHARDRLVEQHQARARCERGGDLELALLAVREIPGEHIGAPSQPDLIENRPRGRKERLLLARRPPEAEAVAGVRLDREHHVLERGEIGIDAGDLERAREPLARSRLRRERGNVFAGEAHATRVGAQVARQLCDQRRLPGAVRSDYAVRLAFPDLEIDVVAREQRSEALGEAADFEQCFIHFVRRAGPRARA
jgi:hypothetical protein